MAHSGVRYVHMYLCYHRSECCTLCYNSPSPPLQKNQDMESGQPKKEMGIEKMSTEAPGSGQNYLGLLLKRKQMCPQSPAKSVRQRLLETHSHKALNSINFQLWQKLFEHWLTNSGLTYVRVWEKGHFCSFLEVIRTVWESGGFDTNHSIWREMTCKDVHIF